ncbi:MAG: hypothetical protein ACK5Y2_11060, partial [Bdellovibrionales bacterium]
MNLASTLFLVIKFFGGTSVKFLALFLFALQGHAQSLLNVDVQEVLARDMKAPAWAAQVVRQIHNLEPLEFSQARIRISEIKAQQARGH